MEPKNKYGYIQLGIDISNTVRSTLGPKGMNKMVLLANEQILTNDGATIIKNINFKNPIGELFKRLAESQEKAVGDGTTTATILTGQLLENALNLLNKNVHPTTIINGYNISRSYCLDYLDKNRLQADKEAIIKTTFGSKLSPEFSKLLINLLKEADMNRVRLAIKENSDFNETKLFKGFTLQGHTVNDRMPQKTQGRIAMVEAYSDMEFAKFQITNSDELGKISELQKNYKQNIVDKLKENDVKIAFISDTNPILENLLAEADIMTVVTYKREVIDNICSASGSQVITDVEKPISPKLGFGEVIYDKDSGTITILNENSKIDTLLLCGPTKQILEEAQRSLDDVFKVLKNHGDVVVGGGAIEIELALYLRELAKNIGGKEQIAIEGYADSLESIPLILAENCGHDAIETLTLLKNQHIKGKKYLGVDPVKVISDAKERNIFELLKLKAHALSSATDVANLILKLDDIYDGKSE